MVRGWIWSERGNLLTKGKTPCSRGLHIIYSLIPGHPSDAKSVVVYVPLVGSKSFVFWNEQKKTYSLH